MISSPAYNIQLSIILPCFNAAGHLGQSLSTLTQTLENQFSNWEIFVVDDGSTDNTKLFIETLSDSRIKLIRTDKNLGKYASIKRGVSESSGEVTVFTDSDLPYGANIIVEIYRTISSGRAQVVVGDRSHSESTTAIEAPPVRKLASRFFSQIAQIILPDNVKDTQCGLKGFNREVANKLLPLIKDNRFGGDFELIFLTTKYNLQLATIPVQLSSVGKSSVNVVVDGVRILIRTILTFIFWNTGRYPTSLK